MVLIPGKNSWLMVVVVGLMVRWYLTGQCIFTSHLRDVTTKAIPNAPRESRRGSVKNRSQTAIAALERERDAWLATVKPAGLFHRLFDHLPGLFFFAKDKKGRFMFASREFPQHYHMREERDILGLTDYDLSPQQMATGYIQDDRLLVEGKVPCVERLELWFDRQGLPDWFFVTKLPLLGRRNQPVGTMGVLRRAAEHEMRLPVLQTVAKAVEIIRRDQAQKVVISEVARACGLSLRHLQRRFQDSFGFSPQEFLVKTRVLSAMQLLEETSLGAAEIARRTGFHDASRFAEQFRLRTGQSPSRWRHRRTPV
jgi:AraC-like DNA-binding protein